MTTGEKYNIFADVEQILSYNTGVDCNASHLMRDWYNGKKRFIEDYLDGKLIYEYPEPVTFSLTEEEKKKMMHAFLDWLDNNFIWSDIPPSQGDLAALYSFVADNMDDFFINKLRNDITMETTYDDMNPNWLHFVTIPAGIKMIKAFKYFVRDKKLLSLIQDKASEYLQKEKITGKLCLSVHPLDYLSISENTLGWRSCHALNGDYAAGNLSYMTDNCTIVCYLKSENDALIPRFGGIKWNNKKWRMLIYISNNERMIFAGRQYPFATDAGLRAVRKLLLEQLLFVNDISWTTEWHNERVEEINVPGLLQRPRPLSNPHYFLGSRSGLVPMNELIEDNANILHYNDLLKSTVYTKPYYLLYDPVYGSYNKTKFKIGHNVLCPGCGKTFLIDGEFLVCEECNAKAKVETCFCDYCGEEVSADDTTVIGNVIIVCPSCLRDYTAKCCKCGEIYFTKTMKFKPEIGFVCVTCEKEEELTDGARSDSEIRSN